MRIEAVFQTFVHGHQRRGNGCEDVISAVTVAEERGVAAGLAGNTADGVDGDVADVDPPALAAAPFDELLIGRRMTEHQRRCGRG